MSTKYAVGILGGTGAQGRGLALRFALHGHQVVMGSRNDERAVEAAREVRGLLPDPDRELLTGASNEEAAAFGSVVVVATPWDESPDSHKWLSPLTVDKVVISCVNPLGFDKQGAFGLQVRAGSAAEHLAAQLPAARVAGSFHHVAAGRLSDPDVSLEEDVLIASDDPVAARVTSELAVAIAGRGGINVGPLRMCRQLETWTAVLIGVNRNYRTHSGVTLTNVDLAASVLAASPAG